MQQTTQSITYQKFSKILSIEKIRKILFSFIDEETSIIIKDIFQINNLNSKQYKQTIKTLVSQYIIDFGKYNEKVKYYLNEHILKISTNIFNVNSVFVSNFADLVHKDETIHLSQDELKQYIKLTNDKNIILSSNKINNNSTIKISKYLPLINMNSKNDNNEKINEFFPLKFLKEVNYWSIILCSGGDFSFGLFLKDREITHKSDHKYVVRKKAGKRQIIKDKSKNISSIGSQIRRANEKQHQNNIESIFMEYKNELDKCDFIFIQAPGINKTILLGDKSENKLLSEYKDKIYNLPLNLPKANYTYLCDAYKKLTNCFIEIKDINI